VVGRVALRVCRARVVGHARVQAVGVDAHFGNGALWVAATAD
jgi:acetoin utilization deacetylase AcuC-like enzyme